MVKNVKSIEVSSDSRSSLMENQNDQEEINLQKSLETLRKMLPYHQEQDPKEDLETLEVMQETIDYIKHLINILKNDEETFDLSQLLKSPHISSLVSA